MKKRRTMAALAVLCMAACLISGCASRNDRYTPLAAPASESDDGWDAVGDGMAVLENDSLYFELDAQTTHFTIRDKRSGRTYDSVPSDPPSSLSNETDFRLASEITVCYYAEQTSALYMYSDFDSVSNKTFTVKTNGEAIRVYYSMGAMDQLLPVLFTKEVFEDVLSRFENNALRRRMERFYVLYSAEDKPEDYAEKLAQYPVLADRPLYILSDVLADSDKEDIVSDLADVGFTEDEYQTMMESLQLEAAETDTPAGFLIPVEYRLTKDGFTASVLSDRIQESSEKYKLYTVDLLEYFAALEEGDGCAFVVPDGSGSLIHLDGKSDREFSKPFYGEDVSIQPTMSSDVGKSLVFPVYGIQAGDHGVFAVVEEAAELALLKAHTSGNITPLHHIYPSFALRSIDTTGSFAEWGVSQYNLFAHKRTAFSPKVRYFLLEEGRADYAAMAALYRDYLLETNGLPVQAKAEPPVYLDYLCMVTEDASILGVPYTKKVVLSTLSEITASVEKLQAEGIRGLVVRLIGYGSAGMENGVYNSLSLDKRVGTIDELKKLSNILRENGGGLYLDADMQFVYIARNGFEPSNDAARYINRKLVRLADRDLVTNRGLKSGSQRYFVSPARFRAYAADFFDDLKRRLDGTALPGLSYGTAGLCLGGDYSPQRSIDRTESRLLLQQALDGIGKDTSLLFDYGNTYILPYATGLLNAPLYDSQLIAEDETIPFFQMVVHGSIPYAGGAENLAADNREAYLRGIEYGAAPYAVFITREDSLLNHTKWQTTLFSVSSGTRLSGFAARIRETEAIRRETQNKRITAHTRLSDTLFCTTYEGGYRVYVNYGDEEAKIEGTAVPPRGFAAVGQTEE